MSIYTITEAEFDRDCRWLFETVTGTLDKIAKYLTETEVSVNCGPRYIAGFVAPYSFAGKLRLLFEYARGTKKLSASLVDEITLDFYRMMTLSPISSLNTPVDIDDDDDDNDIVDPRQIERDSASALLENLYPHPISVIILGAQARAKLEAKKWLNAAELRAVTDLTPDRLPSASVESRSTKSGALEFSPDDVQRILNLRHS